MIKTEDGLTFKRTRDGWRCAEHPELRMYPDGLFGFDNEPRRYLSAASALASRPPAADSPAG